MGNIPSIEDAARKICALRNILAEGETFDAVIQEVAAARAQPPWQPSYDKSAARNEYDK